MKIFHPGYGPSGLAQAKNDFVFSDNITRWMGTKKRTERQEKDKVRQKKNYYKSRKDLDKKTKKL